MGFEGADFTEATTYFGSPKISEQSSVQAAREAAEARIAIADQSDEMVDKAEKNQTNFIVKFFSKIWNCVSVVFTAIADLFKKIGNWILGRSTPEPKMLTNKQYEEFMNDMYAELPEVIVLDQDVTTEMFKIRPLRSKSGVEQNRKDAEAAISLEVQADGELCMAEQRKRNTTTNPLPKWEYPGIPITYDRALKLLP